MTRPWRRARRWALLVAAGLLAAGCGVPTQDAATPITVESLAPPAVAPTASPSAEGPRLWFAQDGRLVSVTAPTDVGTSDGLLSMLAAGPPPGSPGSMRTLLDDPAHGGTLLRLAEEDGGRPPVGTVTVAVSEAFNSLPAEEQVLLLGQVVMTLGGAGAASVRVTDAVGKPLAVPLPDGRLLDQPATPRDYLPLVE